jgi:hypothetical protein
MFISIYIKSSTRTTPSYYPSQHVYIHLYQELDTYNAGELAITVLERDTATSDAAVAICADAAVVDGVADSATTGSSDNTLGISGPVDLLGSLTSSRAGRRAARSKLATVVCCALICLVSITGRYKKRRRKDTYRFETAATKGIVEDGVGRRELTGKASIGVGEVALLNLRADRALLATVNNRGSVSKEGQDGDGESGASSNHFEGE